MKAYQIKKQSKLSSFFSWVKHKVFRIKEQPLLPEPIKAKMDLKDDEDTVEEVDKQIMIPNFAGNPLVYEKKFDYF